MLISFKSITFFLVFLLHGCIGETDDDLLYDTFPEGFLWGTATSSYQIEGAWNISGKGENIWDTFTHEEGNIEDGSNGDIACDSYHKYLDDIQLMVDLGIDVYRFSISWSRVLPDGTLNGGVNAEGVQFYQNLINALLANGIRPMITLYHWDLPQNLQDQGGWENPDIIEHFKDYADLCFSSFGDRVDLWLTFNEPFVFIYIGNGVAVHAPGIFNPGELPYILAHNVLKAHARAWHHYNDTYRNSQQGSISITLDSDWKQAENESNELNVAAGERAMQFKLGWFANPIYGPNGDYPEVMKEYVYNKSMAQGYNQSRLPEFLPDEIEYIKGTSDFFGLNHYTSQYIVHADRGIDDVSYDNDQDLYPYVDDTWPTSGSAWLRVVPWGLRRLLNWIKVNYNNPAVFITENGMSDRNSSLQDGHRVYFYKHYINNVLRAIKEDDCNVIAYTAWSLLDNFEWAAGYTEKFGLHYVNFSDPDRPRTPKESAGYYAQLIRDNGFVEPVTGEPVTGDSVTQEPGTQDPVTGEPVTDDPMTQDPTETADPTDGTDGVGLLNYSLCLLTICSIIHLWKKIM